MRAGSGASAAARVRPVAWKLRAAEVVVTEELRSRACRAPAVVGEKSILEAMM